MVTYFFLDDAKENEGEYNKDSVLTNCLVELYQKKEKRNFVCNYFRSFYYPCIKYIFSRLLIRDLETNNGLFL